MKISQPLQEAINAQIGKEFYASNLYLNIAAKFREWGLEHLAAYFEKQSKEERAHADKLYTFVVERNGCACIGAIEAPPTKLPSPLDCAVAQQEQELKVTESLTMLYNIAVKENDYGAQQFLDWFMAEQVEEERSAYVLVRRLRMAGDNTAALLIVDHEYEED